MVSFKGAGIEEKERELKSGQKIRKLEWEWDNNDRFEGGKTPRRASTHD